MTKQLDLKQAKRDLKQRVDNFLAKKTMTASAHKDEARELLKLCQAVLTIDIEGQQSNTKAKNKVQKDTFWDQMFRRGTW